MRVPLLNKAGDSPAVLILQLAQRLRQHPSFGFAMAFVTVGLASLIQWLGYGQYEGAPFLTIYPAIIVTTLIGGREAGFLAALLSGISQWSWFIPAFHWFAVTTYTFDAAVAVMLGDYINKTLDLLLINIDREKQAKQHQYLLAKELHHRIQNLFTVIQAVVRFSLPGDGMVKESAVKQRLMDRLQSMSATHRAITDSLGDGVRLRDLIDGEIRGFESRFQISGGAGLVLAPQMTQNFSLILHELITNAIKYGALSTAHGRVRVRLDWIGNVLTFIWQELDGPPVAPPSTAGFGSRILGAFAKSFCRKVDARYESRGFRYVLDIDSDQIKCILPGLIATLASDIAGDATDMSGAASLDDARGAPAWLGRAAEFKH
jgi:two-component sensor histidine kinase